MALMIPDPEKMPHFTIKTLFALGMRAKIQPHQGEHDIFETVNLASPSGFKNAMHGHAGEHLTSCPLHNGVLTVKYDILSGSTGNPSSRHEKAKDYIIISGL